MLVLVPVSQYQVDYIVARGRPYSHLERLILLALDSGDKSLEELDTLFCIHRRLLIESLVTLTLAGWVAFSGSGLSLTAEGKAAIESGGVPRVRFPREETSYVLMEKLTGLVATNRVQFSATDALEKDGLFKGAVKLRPRVHVRGLDAGRLDRLLHRGRDEWIDRIVSVHQRRRGGIWLKLDVNATTGAVTNLPEAWAGLDSVLRSALRDEMAIDLPSEQRAPRAGTIRAEDLFGRPMVAEAGAIPQWSLRRTPVHGESLVTDGQAHEALLFRALETAERVVFVVSSFVRCSALEALKDRLYGSLQRGVSVGFLVGLPGDQPEEVAAAGALLKKFSFDASQFSGRFEYALGDIGTHAKALLWDGGSVARAAVGSFNWLSSVGVAKYLGAANISFVVEDSATVASLTRTFAEWCGRSERGRHMAMAAVLKRLAGDLERRAIEVDVHTDEGACDIGVVRDTEHRTLLSQLVRGSARRVAVLSYNVSEVGPRRLAIAQRETSTEPYQRITAYCQVAQALLNPGSVEEALAVLPGTVRRVERLHSKVLVGDDDGYVGSYNFLSSDPYDTGEGASELGLFLRGKAITDRLWRYVEGVCGTTGEAGRSEHDHE